jgi:drug/metabolite transporter (DMT)-like permease
MNKSFKPSRLRWNGIALAIAGIFFVLYPALKPFSDEFSLQGAAAFGSPYWLLAHMLAMVAFTLLPLGLLGLYSTLQNTTVERVGYWAFVLSLIGVGFTLPFYGIVDTLAEWE